MSPFSRVLCIAVVISTSLLIVVTNGDRLLTDSTNVLVASAPADTATPSPTPTSPRTGTVYWTGDFSTGDWSQWGNPQAGKSISPSGIWGNEPNTPYNGNASLAIVTSPVRHPGGHAVQLVTGNRSDIQTLRAAGAASGSFALDWAGSTSALINWNDTAATIQSKLNAMPAVSAAGGVIVDAPLADGTAPNGPLNTTTQYIMFNAAGPHAAFTISNSTLVGATPSISFGVSAPNYPHDDASIIVNTSDTHASAGQSTYYGFSMYVPSSTNGQWVDNDGAMNIFWEVQGQGNTLSMGVDTARSDGFSASNPGFYLTGDWAGSPRWVDSSPMQYDTWTDFVIRIRWSYDDSGVIEICKNGTNVYSNVSTPTLAPNQSRLYMQAMNYHQPSPNVISYYLAEHRIGDSYSAVAP